MSDNTSIPILLDGDTGYGNFNNARRLIRKLEQRGIAGVCIEDKLFPKTNSLLEGVSQPLADIDEFCGKIKACKDAQKDDAFSGTKWPSFPSLLLRTYTSPHLSLLEVVIIITIFASSSTNFSRRMNDGFHR